MLLEQLGTGWLLWCSSGQLLGWKQVISRAFQVVAMGCLSGFYLVAKVLWVVAKAVQGLSITVSG